jgi:WD40 repeat protein
MRSTPTHAGPTRAAGGERAGVFISYSRSDRSSARDLERVLLAEGREVWADWSGIPPGARWQEEVAAGVEAADVFLVVLSPMWVASEECGNELAQAIERNKRIVVVVVARVDADAVHGAVRSVQWIVWETGDGASAALTSALDADFDWMRDHTRLLADARAWEERGGDPSLLLRRRALARAEAWLVRQDEALGRRPTPLQIRYLVASRGAATRLRNRGVAAVGIVAAALLVLAVVATLQRRTAVAREHVARSRELAVTSLSVVDADPQVGLLLAAEANRASRTPQADAALRQALLTSHLRREIATHQDRIWSAAFSPNGRLVATGGEGGTVRVWRVADGRPVSVYQGHGDRVNVEFAPDGRRVLSAGPDALVAVSDATTGRPVFARWSDEQVHTAAFVAGGNAVAEWTSSLRLLDARTGRVKRTVGGSRLWKAVSADGALAISSKEHQLDIWSLRRGRVVASLRGLRSIPRAVTFSADGRRVAAATGIDPDRAHGDGVLVWATTGEKLAALRIDDATEPTFSANGRFLLASSSSGVIRIWDTTSWTQVSEVAGHDAVFSQDGALVVTSLVDDAAVRVYRTRGGAQLAILRGSSDIDDLAFSRDGRTIATTGYGIAHLWDATAPRLLGTLESYQGGVGAAVLSDAPVSKFTPAVSADGRLVVAPAERHLNVWDLDDGTIVSRIRDPRGDVVSVAFNPGGTRIVTTALDLPAALWDTRSGRRVAVLDGVGYVFDARFSADGRRLVVLSERGRLSSFDANSGRLHERRQIRGLPATVSALAPDGSVAAGTARTREAMLWSTSDGAIRVRAHIGTVNPAATFSADGSRVAFYGDSVVDVVDTQSGKTRRLAGSSGVSDLTFSADGRLAAAGEASGSVGHVWDTRSGRRIADLRGHHGRIEGLAFSADGGIVVTGGFDGTTRLWSPTTGRQFAVLSPGAYSVETVATTSHPPRFIVDQDETLYLYDCMVCRPLDDLLRLARTRTLRPFTADERATYLN